MFGNKRQSRPSPANSEQTAPTTSTRPLDLEAKADDAGGFPTDERELKELFGFDRNDPNVTVTVMRGDDPRLAEMLEGSLGVDGITLPKFEKLLDHPGTERLMKDIGLDADFTTDSNGVSTETGGRANPFAGDADKARRFDEAMQKGPAVAAAMLEVLEEVSRATAKHAPMTSPHEAESVIREEFEELWDEIKADNGRGIEARKEAVQLAAMAIRYLIDINPAGAKYNPEVIAQMVGRSRR